MAEASSLPIFRLKAISTSSLISHLSSQGKPRGEQFSIRLGINIAKPTYYVPYI